jgi:enamine deaminase RidA (YjgF/YER057c/UK114 family)
MARKVLTPERDGRPIGMYSAGFQVDGGSLVFVAGQVAMDAEGRIVGEGDIRAQATQVYRNLAAVLAEARLTLRDVVKFTTFLTRNEDWLPFGEWRKAEYPRLFPDGVYPPNTGVVVHALARPQLLLEVEAIAVRPGRPASGGAARTRAAASAPAGKRGGRAAVRRPAGKGGAQGARRR